jgi:hypothetical protein
MRPGFHRSDMPAAERGDEIALFSRPWLIKVSTGLGACVYRGELCELTRDHIPPPLSFQQAKTKQSRYGALLRRVQC